MKKYFALILMTAAVLICAEKNGLTASASTGPADAQNLVVGYYANWSAYDGYTPKHIPADKLTHINYAFAKIDPATGRLAMANPDIDRKNFGELSNLKKQNPGLRTIISVGGWDYSTYFSTVAATEGGRENFAQSCLDFILEHSFDGVDLDWEYPVSGGPAGNGNSPADRENFTLLLSAIRNKLNQQGAADGKRYELTIAGAASSNYLRKIEPVKVASLVDFIFVMAYDMHGSWDSYADLSAPLHQPYGYSPQYKNSVADGVAAYVAAGVPKSKLVLGVPFYGYVYEGVSMETVGAGIPGLYSPFRTARSVSYDRVKSQYLTRSGMQKAFHAEGVVPVLYGDNLFLSYEDPVSVTAKAAYAGRQGLAGVGSWELSHNKGGELVNSLFEGLRAEKSGR